MTDRSTLIDVPVISAPHRAERPAAFEGSREPVCPFCPGQEHQTPPPLLVVGQPDWDIRVVPNLYPIVPASAGEPAHEVVIETPHHDDSPSRWSPERTRGIIDVWIERLARMSRRDDIEASLMFRNQGVRGGASLEHPHSQIIGLASTPERIAARCIDPCRICIDLETTDRILGEADDVVAWCPSSPLMPWEIAISSRSHEGAAEAIRLHAAGVAKLLRQSIAALDAMGLDAQNWILPVAPRNYESGFHWTLSLHPRVSAVAGFELATGTFVNVIDPDRAYRELSAVFNDVSPSRR